MFKKFLGANLALLYLVMVIAGSFSTAQAQRSSGKTRWVKLATKTVNLRSGKATFNLRGAKGAYNAIRLRAVGGSINIGRIAVKASNNAGRTSRRRSNLKPGRYTRTIKLRRSNSFVNSVEIRFSRFTSSSSNNSRRRGALRSGTNGKATNGSSSRRSSTRRRSARRTASAKTVKIEVWGLQSAQGARMRRGRPGGGQIASLPSRPKSVVNPRAPTGSPKFNAPRPGRFNPSRPSSGSGRPKTKPKVTTGVPRQFSAPAAPKKSQSGGGREQELEERTATFTPPTGGTQPGSSGGRVRTSRTPTRETTSGVAEGGTRGLQPPAPAPLPQIKTQPQTRGPASSGGGSDDTPLGRGSDEPETGTGVIEDNTATAEPVPLEPAGKSVGGESPAGRAPLDPASLGTKDYDVMPVFYGTDRKDGRKPGGTAKKPVYGSERAEKLNLGFALVTVPKVHTMPNVERPWAINIPFIGKVQLGWEDPKKHFTIKDIRQLSRLEFISLARDQLSRSKSYKDQALIFIHGFNNSFDGALYRTAQIAFDLKFDGASFVYSWPSAGNWTSYLYDRESASGARPHLKEFLQLVSKQTGAKNVSIIAHSMGNYALLNVLRDLKYAAPDSVKINQIILAAPDVGVNEFKILAKEIQGVSDGVTLYASSNDRALYVSRQFYGAPRAGGVPEGGPLVVNGIDTIDVSALSIETLSANHSSYAQTKEIMGDIERLLKTGERPPETRSPALVPLVKKDASGNPLRLGDGKVANFWRYPAAVPK